MSNKFNLITPYGGMVTINSNNELKGDPTLVNMTNFFLSEYRASDGNIYVYLKDRFLQNFPNYSIYADFDIDEDANASDENLIY